MTDQSPPFFAGAAEIDITPPIGVDQTGFIGRPGPSNAVHDPLAARALALKLGGRAVLLISCDVLALDDPTVQRVREAISAKHQLAASDIMLLTTHTHAGPATVWLRDCGEVSPQYMEELRAKLVSVAGEALTEMRPASVAHAVKEVSGVSYNRRAAEQTIDRDLNLAAFRGEDGKMIAVLLNFPCHAVCLRHDNLSISADYPGALARMVAVETDCPVLFANGACGDINPIHRFTFDSLLATARPLADAALAMLHEAEYQKPSKLRIMQKRMQLPLLPPPSLEDLAEVEEHESAALRESLAAGDELSIQIHRAMLGWVKDTRAGLIEENLITSLPAEAQIIALDDLALCGISGELFNQLGLEVRRSLPGGQVMLLGYANGDIGYLAPREAYAAGGYEVSEAYRYYGAPSATSPDAVRALIGSAKSMLANLT